MPWVDVEEPYASPPRLPPMEPGGEWSGPLDIDNGLAELDDVEVDHSAELDLSSCAELTIRDSVVEAMTGGPDGELLLHVERSTLIGADLSRVTIGSLHHSRLESCKLAGVDLSGAHVSDVVFEKCVVRYANLRMAELSRVAFVSCTFDDVDAYGLVAEDLDFRGSDLRAVNLDALQATRVDLRTAGEISLTAVGRLSGCLIAEHQLPALIDALALAADIDIERSPAD